MKEETKTTFKENKMLLEKISKQITAFVSWIFLDHENSSGVWEAKLTTRPATI